MSTYIVFYPGLYTYVCEGKVASKISDIQKKYKCQTSVCEERQNTVEREEEFRGEVFGGQEFGDVEFGNETYGEMAEDRCIRLELIKCRYNDDW